MPEHVVIAAGARTPFGAFGGKLRDVPIPELAAVAGTEALRRAAIDAREVDEMVLGVNFPGADRSLARQSQLRCGIPEDRVAYTVDRACCSSLTAVSRARLDLLAEEVDIALAGGAENLSLVPFFLPQLRWGRRLGDVELVDQLVISCPYTGVARAVQAADEASRFEISRAEHDAWAFRSQQRAASAVAAGRLAPEIAPIGEVTRDESPRPETSLEKLARLPTVNGSATVTAGNAPGLSTGASCLVLMRESTARRRGFTPLARILGSAMVSGHPARIASIPAVAAELAMNRAGVALADISLIEINEAFAVVPLVTTLQLAAAADADVEEIRARTNVNGGAIAIGHPTGATGGRLLLSIAMELQRRGGGIGLVTMCGGIGEGESLVIEAVSELH